MLVIPLNAVPAQTFTVQINGQNCKINLYQKNTGLFFDLYLNDVLIVESMICLDAVGLVRETYLGFVGQLVFIDTQGNDNPEYTELGSRYILTYWTKA